jgi:tetratricopeptide (TPR) repeat protein
MESKWEISIINCNKACSIFYTVDPTTLPIDWYRGVSNFSLQNFDAAYADFEKAYTFHPYSHHVLNNLATSCELKGWHERAKNYYKEAIRIDPHFDESRLNLAVIYFNEGRYRDAYFWAISCKHKSDRRQNYLNIITQKLRTT